MSLMLGRAFFSGLPMMLWSSGRLFPKSGAADIPVNGPSFAASSSVLFSPRADPAPGDLRELAALSGSTEWARLS